MTDTEAPAKGPVLLAGATGLVGGHCLRQLIRQADRQVVAVVRRPLGLNLPFLQTVVSELGRLEDMPPPALTTPGAIALCALGTTLRRAGSQEAFRAVDRDGVLAFARWCQRLGARSFVLVSSVGAAPASRSFYLRVKAEAEREVAALGWTRLVILRPGLLLGRRDERRPGEAIAQVAMPLLHPLLRGRLRRYRGIDAAVVARAMIAGSQGPPGQVIWHNPEIEAAAASTATATA
jgi:uncharacterized protein YbjT (DUF2867 family)